jgi:heterogeneous nuclear ribonucleoprotein A1/A3
MNIQANAIFLGGVNALTSAETLTEYFSRFGEIVDVVLRVNKRTCRNKGYGFVYYADPASIDLALKEEHVIDGHNIDCELSCNNSLGDKILKRSTNMIETKLFISNLAQCLGDQEFMDYFSSYGEIKQCYLVKNPRNGRSKCFGFVRY